MTRNQFERFCLAVVVTGLDDAWLVIQRLTAAVDNPVTVNRRIGSRIYISESNAEIAAIGAGDYFQHRPDNGATVQIVGFADDKITDYSLGSVLVVGHFNLLQGLGLLCRNSGVVPLAAIEAIIGRAFAVCADAQERAEGIERVEAAIEAEGHKTLLSVSDMRDSLTLSDRAMDDCVSPFVLRAIIFSTCAVVNARGVLRLLLTMSAVLSDLVPSNRWDRLTQIRVSQ